MMPTENVTFDCILSALETETAKLDSLQSLGGVVAEAADTVSPAATTGAMFAVGIEAGKGAVMTRSRKQHGNAAGQPAAMLRNPRRLTDQRRAMVEMCKTATRRETAKHFGVPVSPGDMGGIRLGAWPALETGIWLLWEGLANANIVAGDAP